MLAARTRGGGCRPSRPPRGAIASPRHGGGFSLLHRGRLGRFVRVAEDLREPELHRQSDRLRAVLDADLVGDVAGRLEGDSGMPVPQAGAAIIARTSVKPAHAMPREQLAPWGRDDDPSRSMSRSPSSVSRRQQAFVLKCSDVGLEDVAVRGLHLERDLAPPGSLQRFPAVGVLTIAQCAGRLGAALSRPPS